MNKKYHKAFTLVELLVVVTIIALLTVVAALNYEKAKAKSRDAQRKSDLTKISMALESYKADNKQYIATNNVYILANSTNMTPLTSGGYISSTPTDPLNVDSYKYQYKSDTDGSQYKLITLSETITSDSDTHAQTKAGDYYNPVSGKRNYFQVSSSNTALTTW